MLVTICTIRQLPQALALGDSFGQYAGNGGLASFVIGLADDPTHLPAGFVSPYPLLPISDLLSPEQLANLSSGYTPTEFATACKPLFLNEIFRRYTETDRVLYADPNIQFVAPLTAIWEQLAKANVLLTPFITRSPGQNWPDNTQWPDEKFFQNIGLYSADFLVFQRSSETDRLLAWWDDRVRERAYVNFCAGLCLDQLWLMHVPVFFRDVLVVRNPGWHVALWNLPERMLRQQGNGWAVDGPTSQNQSLQFVNFKGLLNPDEGFFPHQNRVRLSEHSNVETLLASYRQRIAIYNSLGVGMISPAYGKQPEPVVLRGWRHATVKSLRSINRFLDKVKL